MKPILGWTFAAAVVLLLLTGALPGALFSGWLAWVLLRTPPESSPKPVDGPRRREHIADRRKRLSARVDASTGPAFRSLDVPDRSSFALSSMPPRTPSAAPDRRAEALRRPVASDGDGVDVLTHYLDD